MPLSEFHLTTKTKLESPQSKMANCSSDLSSFMPDHEFVELLWENGQILVQGQSNRPRKNSFPTYFPSHTDRVQEKDSSRDAVIPKIGRFGAIETIANDFSPSGPSGQIGLNAQDDDMVPWLSYPIEDSIHSLQNDYCSDIFSEFTGVNLNSLSTHNNITPTDRNIGQTFKDTHNVEHMPASKALAGGSEPSRIRTSQLFPLPQSCQSSVPSRSRGTGFGISSNTHQGLFEDLPNARLQKQDLASSKPLQPIGGMGLMNFSHFSRPAALVKANLQSVDRLRSNEKVSTAASINPMEPTLINSNSDLKSVSRIQDQSASIPAKVVGIERSSAKPPQGVVSVEQSEAICQEDAFRNSNNIITNNSSRSPGDVNCRSSSFTASGALGRHHESEKVPEVVVASSSVCSGNSAGAASNDPKHREKRKTREGEESGYQSEDIEDESVGLKKPATGRGTSVKRSRAAEVHNLSERRRRDRINEKMRALQELIPNCNKVDKASMLDEAIEYLKTLQLQVQIMSMGSGLCMPPMMLPAGMQHMRGPPMAHFSPMGLGMGMGMGLGFGMGMLDMNTSPGCPMVPVQSMHGPQFPCPSVPGAPGLLHGMHGMHGSTSLQMFGIPGQGLPLSMPRPPQYGYLSGFSTKSSSVPENSGTAASPIPAAGSTAPPSSSKDQQQQSKSLETIQKTSTDDPQIPTSTQAAKECFKQSALVKMSSQTLHVSGNAAINSISEDGTASTGTTSYG